MRRIVTLFAFMVLVFAGFTASASSASAPYWGKSVPTYSVPANPTPIYRVYYVTQYQTDVSRFYAGPFWTRADADKAVIDLKNATAPSGTAQIVDSSVVVQTGSVDW